MTPAALRLLSAGIVVAAALAGCASMPAARAPIGVDEVIEARERLAERFGRERVERLVQSDGRRIAELGLPSPAYRGTLPEGEWSTVTAACIAELEPTVTSASLRTDETGELVEWGVQQVSQPTGEGAPEPSTEPPTVSPERLDAFERLALVVNVCAVRHLPDVPALGGIDDLERAWWRDDALQRLLPCLRRAGAGLVVTAPPEGLADRAAAGRPWDPLAGLDAPTRARAAAMCPPGEELLERAQPRAEAVGGRDPRPLSRLDVPFADF